MAANVKKEYLDNFIEALINQIYDGLDGRKVVFDNANHYLQAPRRLYRYCKFDKKGYTLDSIINKYVYLSPATILDDDFECIIDENKHVIENVDSLINTDYYFDYFIKEQLKKYNIYSTFAHSIYKKDKSDDKYTFYFWFKYLIEDEHLDVDTATRVANSILLYVDNKGKLAEECKSVIKFLKETRERTGICSFTTNNASQVMWNMYADNYSGIMIEYDFNIFDFTNIIDIFPVQYKEERKTDPLLIALDIFINSIGKNERSELKEKMKALYNEISIKNTEWSFQDEWRIAGYSKVKSKSPRITGIYLGNKISKCNRKEILELSKKMLFKVYEQKFDKANTRIVYEEIADNKCRISEKELFMFNNASNFNLYTYDDIESDIYADIFVNYAKNIYDEECKIVKNIRIEKYTYNVVFENKKSKTDILFEIKYWHNTPSNDEIESLIKNLGIKQKRYSVLKNKETEMILVIAVNNEIYYDMQYLSSLFNDNLKVKYLITNTLEIRDKLEIRDDIKKTIINNQPKG